MNYRFRIRNVTGRRDPSNNRGGGVFYHGMTDLIPELFLAAADERFWDVERLRELLRKEKHLLLPNEAKNQSMASLLLRLFIVHHNEELYNLLELMIKCDFLNYCSGEVLVNAFSNFRATEIILNFHPTIFLEAVTADDLTNFLRNDEYDLLELLLAVGVDFSRPKDGRNVLDRLLALIGHSVNVTPVVMITQLQCLLTQLQSLQVPTFENYESLLQSKFFEFALHVLEESDFGARGECRPGDPSSSPLSCAFRATDLAVIDGAMRKYLNRLNLVQLQEAKRMALMFCDEEVILIDRVDDRINSTLCYHEIICSIKIH